MTMGHQSAVEADRMRTALLNAVSHDLRTPIASAKMAVASLRSYEVDLSEVDRQELLSAADTAPDRLTGLITDPLDLGRRAVRRGPPHRARRRG
jgi:two-component system sensor histidine kinase KdpD